MLSKPLILVNQGIIVAAQVEIFSHFPIFLKYNSRCYSKLFYWPRQKNMYLTSVASHTSSVVQRSARRSRSERGFHVPLWTNGSWVIVLSFLYAAGELYFKSCIR